MFLQVFMFTIMFCHSMEIFLSVDHPDYTCPRNLLMISMILSSIILTAAVVAMVYVGGLPQILMSNGVNQCNMMSIEYDNSMIYTVISDFLNNLI